MEVFGGAVFDLDGLLIDSEPYWRWAQERALKEAGAELTLEMQLETTGLRLKEAVQVWRTWFPGADLLGVGGRIAELVKDRIRREGTAKAGAGHAIRICREQGCRLAVASSSPMEVIGAALERIGVADCFQAVVTAEAEEHGKPHPAVYLSAARALDLRAADCIAFEDSLHGLRSARAAGMHCVAVPEEHNRMRPDFAVADRILASLEEFRAEFLRRS